MPSGSLHDRLRPPHPPLSPLQKLHILRGVAYGLLALHNAGIVHLDVKPANILLALLGSDVIAKLTDFGISKSLDPASTFAGSTTGGGGGGSLMWMAPEVHMRPPAPCPASDVYGFGMVMYEVLTGQQPWEAELQAKKISPMIITAWVTSGNRPFIPSGVPQPLAAMMQGCWEKDTTARPSLETIIDMLSQCISHAGAVDGGPASAPFLQPRLPVGGATLPPPPPILASSSVDPEYEGLLQELVELKLGSVKVCSAFAQKLGDEGIMSLQEFKSAPVSHAQAQLLKVHMSEFQLRKVLDFIAPAAAASQDAASQRPHFVNTKTGQVQWDPEGQSSPAVPVSGIASKSSSLAAAAEVALVPSQASFCNRSHYTLHQPQRANLSPSVLTSAPPHSPLHVQAFLAPPQLNAQQSSQGLDFDAVSLPSQQLDLGIPGKTIMPLSGGAWC